MSCGIRQLRKLAYAQHDVHAFDETPRPVEIPCRLGSGERQSGTRLRENDLMLQLDMSDIPWTDEKSLRLRLRNSSTWVRVTMTIEHAYQAQSIETIAESWLQLWFVAESLAECASAVSCTLNEGERGTGNFVLDFKGVQPEKMADKLLELGAALDPDDLEGRAWIYETAEEWLANRGNIPSRFPEIEEGYRADAKQAADIREAFPDDDETPA